MCFTTLQLLDTRSLQLFNLINDRMLASAILWVLLDITYSVIFVLYFKFWEIKICTIYCVIQAEAYHVIVTM